MKTFYVKTSNRDYYFEAIDIIDLVCLVLPNEVLQDLCRIEVVE